jgi:hypothetical protein
MGINILPSLLFFSPSSYFNGITAPFVKGISFWMPWQLGQRDTAAAGSTAVPVLVREKGRGLDDGKASDRDSSTTITTLSVEESSSILLLQLLCARNARVQLASQRLVIEEESVEEGEGVAKALRAAAAAVSSRELLVKAVLGWLHFFLLPGKSYFFV